MHPSGVYRTDNRPSCSKRQLWALNQLHEIRTFLREKGGDKERKNVKQAPHTARSPTQVSIPQPSGHNLGRNQGRNRESDIQPTKQATQVPLKSEFFLPWKKIGKAHQSYEEGETIV